MSSVNLASSLAKRKKAEVSDLTEKRALQQLALKRKEQELAELRTLSMRVWLSQLIGTHCNGTDAQLRAAYNREVQRRRRPDDDGDRRSWWRPPLGAGRGMGAI